MSSHAIVTFNSKNVWNGPKVLAAVKKATIPSLWKCGLLVEAEAKKILSVSGKVGKKKKKGNKTDRGIPSTPPDPPHLQTGDLRKAIFTGQDEWTGRVYVGPTRQVKYGKVHEFGGEFGGRNFPRRAFMHPALENVQSQFPKFFASLKIGKI